MKRIKNLRVVHSEIGSTVQFFPEKFRQGECRLVDRGIDVFIFPRRIGGLQSVFPGRVGDIHEADPAAGVGGDVGVIVREILRQGFGGTIDGLYQFRVEIV